MKGELLTKAQSFVILMLYFHLVKTGRTENKAAEQASAGRTNSRAFEISRAFLLLYA